MKNIFRNLILFAAAVAIYGCAGYESAENDPLNARIYTLENGLKVYMTVNKETPRIQTYIAVRVGAKNDPSETTGLAHYFEHLMFKGTEQFGTMNYQQEKPLLDQIEQKFEEYRKLTDSAERVACYAVIDSLSLEASKYAIPNEYDKLMSAIGAKGTNAYTGYDMTVYVEDIPSNQIENWAKIQADRFKHNIIRGFHTELETVYEEKNMSLTNDFRKVIERASQELFKKHPYGLQTVLGTQENLKNPSITNIKNYYSKWYVPNNMAICLSGDFDPENMLEVIKKYFGDMKPNPNLEYLKYEAEDEIERPIQKEVRGLESPFAVLAWRFPGSSSKEIDTLTLLSNVLYNGRAGLLDLNVNQAQRTLSSSLFLYEQSDYTMLFAIGEPKEGQGLEEVKGIMMDEIEKLKKGEFDQELIAATINNYKKQQLRKLESNSARANMFVEAFISGTEWNDAIHRLDRIERLTKEDLVAFAQRHFKENYVQINKIQGVDNSVQSISKPKITAIHTNRDTSSNFLKEIQQSTVEPIEPKFIDFAKDMSVLKAKGDLEVLYKQNTTNNLYTLAYLYDFGSNEEKMLEMALNYMEYLGTESITPEQKKQKLYSLAQDCATLPGPDETIIYFQGLSETMKEGVELFEEVLSNAKPNEQALQNLKDDMIKERQNAKLSQRPCYIALEDYVTYGKNNPTNNTLSNKEILEMTSDQLIAKLKELLSIKHTILYYGPETQETLLSSIAEMHKASENLKEIPKNTSIQNRITKENEVFIAPYDAKQIYMMQYSNTGEKYDAEDEADVTLYNNYFGSGMNAIVFQEMREARGLAYSAMARYNKPTNLQEPYTFTTFIATQNDKLIDATTAFEQIINDMPKSEPAFNIAKENLIAKIRSQRTTKENVLFAYYNARKLGLNYDINSDIFQKVQNMTLQDVVNFQEKKIKNRVYSLGILGKESDLDMKGLEKLGYKKVTRLSLEEIFGY